VRKTTSGQESVDGVVVVDAPEARVRQSSDALGMAVTAAAIALVLVLSVYAHATTRGVLTDALSITRVLNSILQAAVYVLNNLATMVMPVIVLISLVARRQPRLVLDGAIAAAGGLVVAWGAAQGLGHLTTTAIARGLSVGQSGELTITVPMLAVLQAALLTAVGPRSRRPVLALSWNLLWAALATNALTGRATLPMVVVTVLLGRLVGQAVRYLFGVSTNRASGRALVEGIRRAGIDPVRVVRVRDISTPENPTIRLDVSSLRNPDNATPPDPAPHSHAADPTALALERVAGNRVYAVYDAAGTRLDAIVLDQDRQVVGMLQQTWRALRLRGMDRRSVVSLRQAAERAALLAYAAAAAGVRTPHMAGIGEAEDSMILLQRHPAGLRTLGDMHAAEISDASLAAVWEQLAKAHEAGLAHRAITSDSVLFGPHPDEAGHAVWLIGWHDGDIASSDLARRLDVTQMLAVLALAVGADRAVASAATVLERDTLTSVAPLLQPVALPAMTRTAAKSRGDVLPAVRQALLDLLPEAAESEPFRLVRLGWRTVALVTISAIVLLVVITRLDFAGIVDAVRGADPWWMTMAFALSLTTYVGAAMAMKGFAPITLPMGDTLLTQVAASFVALAAPAGMGPAALNLRLLQRKRVATSLAVASVAIVQLTLFATTVLLLVVVSAVTGDSRVFHQFSSTGVLIGAGVVVVLCLVLAVPKVRGKVWRRFGPTFAQAWPRLVWVLGQPKKLALGLGGNLLQAVGYVAAFWASLQAFGVSSLSPMQIALIYFLGNAAGSAVPTPGGLGAVEFAMTTGLAGAGLGTALAASIAVLFRALTYWARVPLGWLAWRWLQSRDLL